MTRTSRKAGSKPVTPDSGAASLSRAEKGWLYLLMILSPLILLGMLEVGLRVVGYGDDYPLFVPVEGSEGYLFQNRDVARRYFVNLETIPTSLLDFFPVFKHPGTFRIFVQGGSSAAGFPFYYGGAFSRMLEQRLAQTYPDRRIEVINTSMAAINSFTLLDLQPEIIERNPDAILIYAGHNEYYGALGVGSSESFGRAPWLKRLYLRMREFRTVQGLRELLAKGVGLFGRKAGEIPNWTMMSQMVGEQQIPFESDLYHAGLRQFESNLSKILAGYRDHGIPVFVSTLASNEGDHRPFIGEPEGQALNAYVEGMRALGEGDLDAARGHFRRSISLDSLAADPWFALGKIAQQEGRFDEAREAFLKAKDRDELRFRAPEAMNQIIREVADRFGATVVDAQRALAARSPGGIIGDNLMTEHLHPNVDGYFGIADAFYDALVASRLIGVDANRVADADARREILLTPVDSMAGMLRIRKLKRSWPFQPPGVVDRSLDTLRARNPVEQIAIDLTNDRVNWLQANEALRTYYEQQGNLHRALQAALAQIQEFPFIAEPYLNAGNVLVRQRRFTEALAYFRNSVEVEETAIAHRMIGSILLEQGARDQAMEHLSRSIELNPDDAAALYNLAGAFALEGNYAETRRLVTRVLELRPDHADARRLLESLPDGPGIRSARP